MMNQVVDLTAEEDDDVVMVSTGAVPRPFIMVMPSTFPQFEMVPDDPTTHRFYGKLIQPANPMNFNKALKKERTMMSKDLPAGIYVKMYETRMDLVSVMIEGPTDTPYGGCFYFFDIQFSPNYPAKPPGVQYVMYWKGSIHPNMYPQGPHYNKVCLSLLGNWSNNPLENWQPNKSTLLQLVVSLQGLVLAKEPMYNLQNRGPNINETLRNQSKLYNGNVIVAIISAMTRQIQQPPAVYKDQVMKHYRTHGFDIHSRIMGYINAAESAPFPLAFNNRDVANANLQAFYFALVGLLD